jgi:phosphonopyruvate decarboxylase
VSLCSKGVFNIPIIFLIGWRGDPNTKDEPQHVFQGEITLKTIDILAVPTLELNSADSIDYLIGSNIVQESVANRKSCAILFASGAI